MDSLAICQQDNPKIPIFHLRHLNPTPNSAVYLEIFPHRRLNGTLNP
jgi:hypothetical protein